MNKITTPVNKYIDISNKTTKYDNTDIDNSIYNYLFTHLYDYNKDTHKDTILCDDNICKLPHNNIYNSKLDMNKYNIDKLNDVNKCINNNNNSNSFSCNIIGKEDECNNNTNCIYKHASPWKLIIDPLIDLPYFLNNINTNRTYEYPSEGVNKIIRRVYDYNNIPSCGGYTESGCCGGNKTKETCLNSGYLNNVCMKTPHCYNYIPVIKASKILMKFIESNNNNNLIEIPLNLLSIKSIPDININNNYSCIDSNNNIMNINQEDCETRGYSWIMKDFLTTCDESCILNYDKTPFEIIIYTIMKSNGWELDGNKFVFNKSILNKLNKKASKIERENYNNNKNTSLINIYNSSKRYLEIEQSILIENSNHKCYSRDCNNLEYNKQQSNEKYNQYLQSKKYNEKLQLIKDKFEISNKIRENNSQRQTLQNNTSEGIVNLKLIELIHKDEGYKNELQQINLRLFAIECEDNPNRSNCRDNIDNIL